MKNDALYGPPTTIFDDKLQEQPERKDDDKDGEVDEDAQREMDILRNRFDVHPKE